MAERRLTTVTILCAVILSAFVTLSAHSNGARTRTTPILHQVLAFYYPWWGTPTVSGEWRHWGVVDLAAHRASGITDYPAIGPYDSHDPRVIEAQVDEARQAGVTGFILSWWGINSFEDQTMPLLLRAAAQHQFLVSVYYEHAAGKSMPERREAAYRDIKYLVQNYGQSPSFLKVGGAPVVFLYDRVLNDVSLSEWSAIEHRLRQDDGLSVLLIGPGKSGMAAVFDGVHVYVAANQTAGKAPAQLRTWAASYYHNGVVSSQGKISCVTVIPGFDDRSQTDRPKPRPVTGRFDGETYRTLWNAALAARPDWILITSWNEWHEGTEIEPSTEYDNTALTDTPALSRALLSMPIQHHNLPTTTQP